MSNQEQEAQLLRGWERCLPLARNCSRRREEADWLGWAGLMLRLLTSAATDSKPRPDVSRGPIRLGYAGAWLHNWPTMFRLLFLFFAGCLVVERLTAETVTLRPAADTTLF